ncbi:MULTISPECIES: alpha/beta hydrolase [Streptomyces]|uniref:alpha/beta hydrolase n=1 Tax=Streptomyces lycopersici TaxID=2974589 RepID=UPI0021D13F4D|nr:esterase family protein [Streptomyces sp. NEAU-383]
MGLTSRSLEYVAIAFAVACAGLTLWLWPRFAGRGVRAWAGRLAALAVTQCAIVAALALAVNSTFQFYGSWDELLGEDDAAPAALSHVQGGAAGPVGESGGLVRPAPPQGLNTVHGLPSGPPARAGEVESVRILGRRSQVANPAYVYLPPQYFQRQYARQRFPVIVAISGYPGGSFLLAQHLRLPQTAGGLIRTGALQPAVIVMVRPTIAPPRDTECVDVPGGPQAETYFARDLPEALRAHYRIGHDPSAWGVLGYSSGGTCALQLTLRHPRVYGAAVALSPDYRVVNDPTTGDLFGSGPAGERRKREHDVLWRLRHLPQPQVSVLVASSRRGESDYGATRDFLAAVRPPMSAQSIILDRGSHNFRTWRRELPTALRWLNGQLTFPQDVVHGR